jgi:hypothetical protein
MLPVGHEHWLIAMRMQHDASALSGRLMTRFCANPDLVHKYLK